MFRLAFIAYLSFVALAGPSFCCCTAQKVGVWLAGAMASADAHAPMHTCCSGKKSLQPTAPARSDERCPVVLPASDGHDCQCPEHDSEAVPSSQRLDTAKSLDEAGSAIAWPAVALLSVPFRMEDGQASRGRPIRTSFAHLSGREILCALQRFLL
ncbi:MAG TPA: hypothetical protein VGN57_10000 [Pirellulaceae bacterium]|jgi:hypothetical protein|nr:hypothetical protein [Pirellulaceae bacterium]